jgi:hypothetical protein
MQQRRLNDDVFVRETTQLECAASNVKSSMRRETVIRLILILSLTSRDTDARVSIKWCDRCDAVVRRSTYSERTIWAASLIVPAHNTNNWWDKESEEEGLFCRCLRAAHACNPMHSRYSAEKWRMEQPHLVSRSRGCGLSLRSIKTLQVHFHRTFARRSVAHLLSPCGCLFSQVSATRHSFAGR